VNRVIPTLAAIAELRLRNQRLSGGPRRRPADVVAWLGAVQAQEYPAARWGLALRMREGTTDAAIRRAVDEGQLLRIHVMRPTWHFVTPADARWMLELTSARVHRTMSTYYRQSGLDGELLARSTAIFERALGEGRALTRPELGAQLARKGIVAKGIRLALMTVYAELEGVICSGPYRGKQLTYAPLADRAPRTARLSRDEAIGELTRRYFRSHGPATIRDFVWWSGLPTSDAKRGLEINRAKKEVIDGLSYWYQGAGLKARTTRAAGLKVRTTAVSVVQAFRPANRVHLLPIYDEYLVAYRDRLAVPHAAASVRSSAGKVVSFQHALVIGGQVTGSWKAKGSTIEVFPLRKLSAAERRGVDEAEARFKEFMNAPDA